jgi:hypothetical protein
MWTGRICCVDATWPGIERRIKIVADQSSGGF